MPSQVIKKITVRYSTVTQLRSEHFLNHVENKDELEVCKKAGQRGVLSLQISDYWVKGPGRH